MLRSTLFGLFLLGAIDCYSQETEGSLGPKNQIFITYRFFLEWPYAKKNDFPFLPHTNLEVGIKHRINDSNEYVSLALTSESIAIPSHRLIRGTIHPGLIIGYSRFQENNNYGYGLDLGWFYHEGFSQSIFLVPHVALNKNKVNGFSFLSQIGVGYIHSFLQGPLYELKNKEFERIRNSGRGHLMPSALIGLGYSN